MNDDNILATQYAIKKEVKSNPKQPSCKKNVWPEKAFVEKDVKSKVAANKRLWW